MAGDTETTIADIADIEDMDAELARRYGMYASYSSLEDPELETYGDGPAEEVDRLLDRYVKPTSCFLDLGCGAGFTLCRLAPSAAEVWGFDQDAALLLAARQRVAALGLANTHVVSGNVAEANDVAQLPDNRFDVVLSRRGPNVNTAVLRTLRSEAWVIQELVRGTLGLKPLFGREPFLPHVGAEAHWLVPRYAELGFLPVSVKDYFYEVFYRDGEHLSEDIQKSKMLWDWTMPDIPFSLARDGAALDLYVRYNTTMRGVRVLHHRSVYVFRRAQVSHFPAIPEVKPLYSVYD